MIAGEQTLEQRRDQHVPPLDAVAAVINQQPLSTREPALRRPQLAPKQEVVADPPRAADRGRRITGTHMSGVRTLQRAHVVVIATEHVPRATDQFEVVRAQLPGIVGGHQQPVGVSPPTLRVGLATLLDLDARPDHEPIIAGALRARPRRAAIHAEKRGHEEARLELVIRLMIGV